MNTRVLSLWGPFYGSTPLLQNAIHHAERLSHLLKATRANDDDEGAASWLIGRVEEIEVFVELVVGRWSFEGLGERAAAGAINGYLDSLHHGLAKYFCDLAPRCCEHASLATSIPSEGQTFERTAEMPAFMTRVPDGEATVIDVDLMELLPALTPAPSTPLSPL